MKVTKPMKVPVLCRPWQHAKRSELHLAAILGFPLSAPRTLYDEVAFWPAVTPALGQSPLDEGLAKSSAELLVAGTCMAPGGQPTPATYVRARLGTIDKRLSVIGDRYWQRGVPSAPEPFVEMPIDWAHAFGGPAHPPNPYGKGIALLEKNGAQVVPLPNIEPYGALLRGMSDRPTPAGFMPMDVTFAERRALAGSFGSDYLERWAPGLPPDHDPMFFNAAPLDQRLAGFFDGDEPFTLENMNAAHPRQEGRLPGLVARAFVAQRRDGAEVFHEVALRCDTVWLMPTIDVGAVVFRGRLAVADDDAADVVHLLVACEERGKPRSLEHYRAARLRRLDKDKGAIAELSDSDLMPERDSGVAPNVSFGELGQWTRSAGIAHASAARGRERQMERARERVRELGGDPSMLGMTPPPEPMPSMDDLDAVAAFMEKQIDGLEGRRAEALGIEARVAEEMAKSSEALGQDVTEVVSQGSEHTGGPPKLRAATLASMRELAHEARAAGTPALGIEEQLQDPEFLAQLEQHDRALLEGYRRGAHLMPVAPPMTEEASHLARSLIQAARDSNEPLCERDLTGAELRNADLSGLDFTRALLEGADLRGADLRGANLEGAVLAKADLREAKLARARLSGANLGGANLEGADLEDARLDKAVLMRARVAGAKFVRADFEEADLIEVEWAGAELRGANLARCVFLKAKLPKTSFAEATLTQATFLECELDDADFSNAKLHKASFISCRGARVRFVGAQVAEAVFVHKSQFPEADFRDARLDKTCMRTTELQAARFERAQMAMADLSECNASRAVFDRALLNNALLLRTELAGASLRGVNLTEALLSKARLAGADFTGAQLCRADLMQAAGDGETRFTEALVAHARFDKDSSAPRRSS